MYIFREALHYFLFYMYMVAPHLGELALIDKLG